MPKYLRLFLIQHVCNLEYNKNGESTGNYYIYITKYNIVDESTTRGSRHRIDTSIHCHASITTRINRVQLYGIAGTHYVEG